MDQHWGNYLMTGTLGTYRISMAQDNLPSDKLVNVGLGNEVSPEQAVPTAFFLTFQKVTSAPAAPTSVETEPAPAPAPEPEVTTAEPPPQAAGPRAETPADTAAAALELKDALIVASRQYIIPVNRNSDLYQYAQANNLGDFLSAEFPVRHQEAEYRAQVFEKGLVYVPSDGSGGVTHVGL
jgi:hypothetical protein